MISGRNAPSASQSKTGNKLANNSRLDSCILGKKDEAESRAYLECKEAGIFDTVIVGRVWGQWKKKDAVFPGPLKYAYANKLEMSIIKQNQWTFGNRGSKVLEEPLDEGIRVNPTGGGIGKLATTHGTLHHVSC